jgi:ADP-ribosyl-[dinitrogen reductase] hydrolase
MRGFPLGIFYPVTQVYAISLDVSQLTHLDPAAAHSSAWLNTMTSCLCRGKSRHGAFRYARSLCTHPEVHRMLGNYAAFEPINSLDAVLCAHAALHAFMTTRSLEDAIVTAVSHGGDADTVGACCGALAGAYYGLDAVPVRWVEKLEGYDRIRDLAERLWVGRVDCNKCM